MKSKTIVTIICSLLTFCTGMVLADGLKDKALMYLPMDKAAILAKPAGVKPDLIGANEPYFAEGKKGEALAISTEDVSINGIVVKGKNLFSSETGSVSYWMKPLVDFTKAKERHYFFAANASNASYIYIMSPEAGFYAQAKNNGKWITAKFNFSWWKKPQWSTESWYHITVTWNKDETVFFVNGNKIFTSKKTISNSVDANKVFVGCNYNQKYQCDALMDEFMSFDFVLSKEQIAELMK